MKKITLFIMAVIVSGVIFGQQTMQKQPLPATGNSATQKQNNQVDVQKTNSVNTYSTPQKSIPAQKYEPQPVQQQPIQKTNPTTYQGKRAIDKGYQKNTIPEANQQHKQELNNTNTSNSDLRSIGKMPEGNHLKNYTGPKPKEVEQMPYPRHLDKPQKDTSASNNNSYMSPQQGSAIKKIAVCEKSPERVYKLTPTMRLRSIVGEYPGIDGLNGYGVHLAAFDNYNYCVEVAKWLCKKYKAVYYIIEDQSGYTHYHLVFGRWTTYGLAKIFEYKVQHYAPQAFAFYWFDNNILLADNDMIIFVK